MTNQENSIVFPKQNIAWAEVKAHFHLGEHHTVEPVVERKKTPEMSDDELVASLNRVYNHDEIEAALVAGEEEDAPDPELSKYYPAPYYVKNNCLGYVKHTKDGEVDVQLCNFVPRISCEILYDDGEEVTREYEITVKTQNGDELPAFRVPAQSFGKLDWVGGNLPARCTLDVTGSVEKHIVHAVKETAAHADLRHVYAHTGWIRQNGEMHFLLPGNPFFEVELDGKCANYGMVCGEEPADLGWLTGMLQLDVVPHDVMLPLMALVFLSPLNSLLRKAGCEPKFVFTLLGRTGAKKSTLSALALSFFGSFTASDLPMSFADTPNSILYTASRLDDILTCVDDSHPSTKEDVTNMNLIAEKLVRGYGDRAQRNRLTSEITMRKTRPPQGNVIMTAEFVPNIGESSLARLFCVEIKPDSIDLVQLREIQDRARGGMLQRCMHSFLVWFRDKYLLTEEKEAVFIAGLKTNYAETRAEWRSRLTAEKIVFHDRLPDTLTCLSIGWRMLTLFLKERNMITGEQRAQMLAEFESILLDLAKKQSAAVIADKPTHVFFRNLFAMAEGGMVSITEREKPKIGNTVVGYEDDTYYYLLIDKSIGEVKRFCENTNQTFTLSSKALTKQLKEEGLLVPFGTSNSDSIKVMKKNVRVTRLRKAEVQKILSTLD